MNQRPYNFAAGPSALPEAVLQKVQSELFNWRHTGMSAMEIGHRTVPFESLLNEVTFRLRKLMQIPANYQLLFLAGGAQVQFAMLPMNLLGKDQTAAYVDSGTWSHKAYEEAQKYGSVHVAIKVPSTRLLRIPPVDEWVIPDDAAYLYYADNETIEGLEFHTVPDVGDIPLVCDMTSNILSRHVDVSRFGVIFASTQKSLGISGLTLVIIRDDLFGRASEMVPAVFDYALQAKNQSLVNTPPTFAIYMMNVMCEWVESQGGVTAFESLSLRKSSKLYTLIDQSPCYTNHVDPAFRSRMNVIFKLVDERLDKDFLAQAESRGLINLKGHRSVGGMRASMYNAVSEHAVDVLAAFMQDFATQHA